MTCPHHWTTTSECPQCLRLTLNKLDAENVRLRVEFDLLRIDHEILLEELASMVAQACGPADFVETGERLVDSQAISAYESAIETLAERGKMQILTKRGRRILARWTPEVTT